MEERETESRKDQYVKSVIEIGRKKRKDESEKKERQISGKTFT